MRFRHPRPTGAGGHWAEATRGAPGPQEMAGEVCHGLMPSPGMTSPGSGSPRHGLAAMAVLSTDGAETLHSGSRPPGINFPGTSHQRLTSCSEVGMKW